MRVVEEDDRMEAESNACIYGATNSAIFLHVPILFFCHRLGPGGNLVFSDLNDSGGNLTTAHPLGPPLSTFIFSIDQRSHSTAITDVIHGHHCYWGCVYNKAHYVRLFFIISWL